MIIGRIPVHRRHSSPLPPRHLTEQSIAHAAVPRRSSSQRLLHRRPTRRARFERRDPHPRDSRRRPSRLRGDCGLFFALPKRLEEHTCRRRARSIRESCQGLQRMPHHGYDVERCSSITACNEAENGGYPKYRKTDVSCTPECICARMLGWCYLRCSYAM